MTVFWMMAVMLYGAWAQPLHLRCCLVHGKLLLPMSGRDVFACSVLVVLLISVLAASETSEL